MTVAYAETASWLPPAARDRATSGASHDGASWRAEMERVQMRDWLEPKRRDDIPGDPILQNASSDARAVLPTATVTTRVVARPAHAERMTADPAGRVCEPAAHAERSRDAERVATAARSPRAPEAAVALAACAAVPSPRGGLVPPSVTADRGIARGAGPGPRPSMDAPAPIRWTASVVEGRATVWMGVDRGRVAQAIGLAAVLAQGLRREGFDSVRIVCNGHEVTARGMDRDAGLRLRYPTREESR